MQNLITKDMLWEYLNWQLSDSLYLDIEAQKLKQEIIESFQSSDSSTNSTINQLSCVVDSASQGKKVMVEKKVDSELIKQESLNFKKIEIKQESLVSLDGLNSLELQTKLSEQNCYFNKKMLSPVKKKGEFIIISLYPDLNDSTEPLQGEQGRLLKKMFEAIEYNVDLFTITTLIKSSEIQFLSWKQLSLHIPFLLQELKLLACEKVLLLGEHLAQLLLKTGDDLTELRQKFLYTHENQQVWVTDDLRNLLNEPKLKKETWLDLQWIKTQI